ncbi:MAG TPA: hypothetical protein VK437_12360 [Steroidobacteraceae bacterium]|nr:hypothetical protein [Steroidobacteraceae bacterium]
MPEQGLNVEINIRSSRYLIASAIETCRHCRAHTRVVALALPPRHETLSGDADGEAAAQESWEVASSSALLFFVEYLPEAVLRTLVQLSPGYRFDYSAASMASYFANHCAACGWAMDDHELHCEPDGAFLPTSEERAFAVELIPIDEPLEALAAGYAVDPQFLGLRVE